MKRLILCLVLILICAAPVSVQAAPIPCDSNLFFAAQITAMQDTTPPPINFYEMHWEFEEGPYQVDHWLTNSISSFIMRVRVQRNGKVLGVATNGEWSVCAKGNGWKKYLMARLP